MSSARYFTFIKACRTLLGKTNTEADADDFVAMCNDVSWFGCYDDGLTPEQAVAEFSLRSKEMDNS